MAYRPVDTPAKAFWIGALKKALGDTNESIDDLVDRIEGIRYGLKLADSDSELKSFDYESLTDVLKLLHRRIEGELRVLRGVIEDIIH